MNKRLWLAIIAQSLIDAIDEEDEQSIESALIFLAPYPKLVSRLRCLPKHKKELWKDVIEQAMGRKPERNA